jgi:hypothetical protein
VGLFRSDSGAVPAVLAAQLGDSAGAARIGQIAGAQTLRKNAIRFFRGWSRSAMPVPSGNCSDKGQTPAGMGSSTRSHSETLCAPERSGRVR